MAYAAQHLLFRIYGGFGTVIASPVENWSCGLRIFTGASSLTEQKKVDFLAAIEAAVKSFHGQASVKAGASTSLLKLSAAYIGLDGKYVGGDSQPTTERVLATPIFGSGAQQLPFSHARVLTLRSDIDRGPGAYGRIYWPSQETISADGKFGLTPTTDFSFYGATLIDAVNTAARAQWTPSSAVSVFSNKGVGTIGTVVRVGAGRAPDTQRRRDNQIAEEHAYTELGTTLLVSAALSEVEYS